MPTPPPHVPPPPPRDREPLDALHRAGDLGRALPRLLRRRRRLLRPLGRRRLRDASASAIAAITVLALVGIVVAGVLAWRQWGFGTGDPPHDDRHPQRPPALPGLRDAAPLRASASSRSSTGAAGRSSSRTAGHEAAAAPRRPRRCWRWSGAARCSAPPTPRHRASFAAHMLAHMGVVARRRAAARARPPGAAPVLLGPVGGERSSSSSLVWGWHAPALRALADGSLARHARSSRRASSPPGCCSGAPASRAGGLAGAVGPALHLDAHDAARRAARARAAAALRRQRRSPASA